MPAKLGSRCALFAFLLAFLPALPGCVPGCTPGYNGAIEADEEAARAWGEVQNQYQRRLDLVPNLVEVVKGAAGHEADVLVKVTQARASATAVRLTAGDLGDPAKVREFEAAQANLRGSLARLMVASESYPDLKATGAFRDLQAQIEGTENRISQARRVYNAAVARYNAALRTWPSSIGAEQAGLKPRAPFAAESGAERAPRIHFDGQASPAPGKVL